MGVIDAIAYGIPVITTPVGGLEKVFHDGIDAMIYETYDLKMLADKLEQLIKSETYRNSIVNEADKLVCSDFNIITICNKIEKYMRTCSPRLAKEKYCTGCMACSDACTHDAIKIVEKNCMPFVKVDTHKCMNCHLCEKACPIITPVKKNRAEEMNVYGGWANDEQTRIDAASGGGFSGLAQSFFHLHKEDKVAVIGATLANNRVYHQLIEQEKDIVLLTNSKYIQSDTQGIYKEVIERLKTGYWILFSGCPCQIAGLYGFLGKKRDSERLITIEVVCHGIASYEALDLHLKYYNSSRIYRFRDKRHGTQDWKQSQCTTIEQNGEEIKLKRKDDMFYAIYAGWMLDRKSCSNCQFAEINRVADITIADFWGLQVPDYYKQGVSLIIANNNKADTMIKAADAIYTFKESLRTAINGNPHLFTGYKLIQFHPIVMWPDFFRKILPKRIRFKILTNRMPYKLFWALYKLGTIYLVKYQKKQLISKFQKDDNLLKLLNNANRG